MLKRADFFCKEDDEVRQQIQGMFLKILRYRSPF